MTPRDLLSEAGAGLLARPARVALTVLGTVIGVAALVATLGLSKTAGSQIVGRFSTVAATDVVITPVPGALGGSRAATAIPWDAESRLRRLNGVAAAGIALLLRAPMLLVLAVAVATTALLRLLVA